MNTLLADPPAATAATPTPARFDDRWADVVIGAADDWPPDATAACALEGAWVLPFADACLAAPRP